LLAPYELNPRNPYDMPDLAGARTGAPVGPLLAKTAAYSFQLQELSPGLTFQPSLCRGGPNGQNIPCSLLKPALRCMGPTLPMPRQLISWESAVFLGPLCDPLYPFDSRLGPFAPPRAGKAGVSANSARTPVPTRNYKLAGMPAVWKALLARPGSFPGVPIPFSTLGPTLSSFGERFYNPLQIFNAHLWAVELFEMRGHRLPCSITFWDCPFRKVRRDSKGQFSGWLGESCRGISHLSEAAFPIRHYLPRPISSNLHHLRFRGAGSRPYGALPRPTIPPSMGAASILFLFTNSTVCRGQKESATSPRTKSAAVRGNGTDMSFSRRPGPILGESLQM